MQQNLQGKIQDLIKDEITITIEDEGACHSCGLHGVCQEKRITIKDSDISQTATIGDRVRLRYDKVIQSSVLVYLWPLLAFFFGVFMTSEFLPTLSEIWSFLAGVFFLTVALLILFLFSKKLQKKGYQVRIEMIK